MCSSREIVYNFICYHHYRSIFFLAGITILCYVFHGIAEEIACRHLQISFYFKKRNYSITNVFVLASGIIFLLFFFHFSMLTNASYLRLSVCTCKHVFLSRGPVALKEKILSHFVLSIRLYSTSVQFTACQF